MEKPHRFHSWSHQMPPPGGGRWRIWARRLYIALALVAGFVLLTYLERMSPFFKPHDEGRYCGRTGFSGLLPELPSFGAGR
jgi:hypothetical protein